MPDLGDVVAFEARIKRDLASAQGFVHGDRIGRRHRQAAILANLGNVLLERLIELGDVLGSNRAGH